MPSLNDPHPLLPPQYELASPSTENGALSWKRNLVFISIAQFLGICGFSFGMPFVAYYMQQLGVPKDNVVFWNGLFSAAAPISLGIMAPIWGLLADRYGRKLMMLRANFGAAIILAGMGFVPNVEWLLVLRLVQGLFAGTIGAAMTLVVCTTPERRHGIALGILTTVVSAGNMAGRYLGGEFAETFGYAWAFRFAGIVLLIAGFLILLAVKENFRPPPLPVRLVVDNVKTGFWARLPKIGPGLPLLLLCMFTAFCGHLDTPVLPLFVQDLNGGMIEGSSRLSGYLLGAGSVASCLAGVGIGWLADRVSTQKIGRLSAFGTGVFLIPQAFANSFLQLFFPRFGMNFCAGGLDPVFQVWLSRMTPEKKRGAIFGWAATFKSIGWAASALLCIGIAQTLGYRLVFWI
jgi:DHA1 family multidrug resistance protein-like MFS transporter